MSGGKEEEQLTEAQRKLEEVAKATIKQCKLEGLVQSSWYANIISKLTLSVILVPSLSYAS